MTPKLNHPFMDGLKVVPEGRQKDVKRIKTWMSSQAHLPEISDQYIYLFLHACYYVYEKTKSAIENYFTIRTNYPAIFSDRDIKSRKVNIVLMELG